MMRAAWIALLPLLATAPRAGLQDGASDARTRELLDQLDSGGVTRAREALDELREIAAPAARAALEGFAGAGLSARRLRSLLVREKGADDCIAGVVDWTEDPDLEVRRNMVEFLAERLRSATSTGFDELGFEALARVASEDTETVLRLESLRALARSDHALSTVVLSRLVEQLTPPERTLAASALAEQPRGREIVVARVQGAFAGDSGGELPDDVLAVWMDRYGTRLAELPQGGASARDRAPFLVARNHPDANVRAVARSAVESYLLRLVELGDPERGEALLDRLIETRPGDPEFGLRRATFTLEHAADASGALTAAREVVRRARSPGGAASWEERMTEAIGILLEGAALVSLDRAAEALVPLGRARAALDGLAAERLDLRGPGPARLGAALFEQRALVELYLALCLMLADGPGAEVDEHARRVHVLSLEAQLAETRHEPLRRLTGGMNEIVTHPLSPFALLFQNKRQRTFSGERVLELELRLCEALARAAPIEMPGFAEGRASPLDPERWALLARILEGLERQVQRYPDGREDRELAIVLARNILQILGKISRENPRDYLQLRTLCRYGLVRADRLREEGRASEARELAQRMLAHIEGMEFALENDVGELLRVQIQQTIGTSLTDEGRPEEAEEMLLMALERAEALERGVGEATRSPRRSSILIGLAVNANVKLGDPEKALGYFERAFALDDNEFTRVLLACYRARAGREQEAREALEQTVVSPQNYYNLACTHALLGDKDRAFELLRRALDENFLTPRSRERQRAWARDDPDLKSLRDDPRFDGLVR